MSYLETHPSTRTHLARHEFYTRAAPLRIHIGGDAVKAGHRQQTAEALILTKVSKIDATTIFLLGQ